jgi:hypothetical protein
LVPSGRSASSTSDAGSAAVNTTRHSPGPAPASVADSTVIDRDSGTVVSMTMLRVVLNCFSPARARSLMA